MASPRRELAACARGLHELVRALAALGDCRRSPSRVTALVETAAIPVGALGPLLRFRAGGYTRNLVFRGEYVEVLIACWAAGASTPVHDHGGQECWFLPLAGAFDTEDYALVERGARAELALLGRARAVRSLDHRDGGAQIHRVRVSDGLAGAVSLHVYAGPVDVCGVFDRARGRMVPRRLRYE